MASLKFCTVYTGILVPVKIRSSLNGDIEEPFKCNGAKLGSII